MTYNITRSLKLIALTLIGLTFAFSSASYAQAQVESNKPIVYIVHFLGDCAGDPIKTPETAKDMTFLECRNVCEGLKTSCSGFSFSVASKNANIVDTVSLSYLLDTVMLVKELLMETIIILNYFLKML